MTNSSETVAAIVLAAGLGKRMGADLPKVMVTTREMPLLHHVLATLKELPTDPIVVVTGYQREIVEASVKNGHEVHGCPIQRVAFAHQAQQKGTGDAVKSALPLLKNFKGTVLVVCGDTPLIRPETLAQLIESHHRSKATVSFLSCFLSVPGSYGRVIRDSVTGKVVAIREAKDCSPTELHINEVNSAIYAIDSAFLGPAVTELKNENKQGEYYLTDIVERATREGQTVHASIITDSEELLGVNTRWELTNINTILNQRRVKALVDSGVKVLDPKSLFVDPEVQVAPEALIGPNVQLCGKTSIGSHAVLLGSNYIKNTTIGANAVIKFGVVTDEAIIGAHDQIGPWAHLRPGTELGEGVHIGNFVETKKARLAPHVKANHLTYLGDCSIGERTNVGAGTITCNYDGYTKHHTTIGADVFIGSDTALVAPVTIHDGATIGAGSVITKDVSQDSLAVTRAAQIEKSGWSKKKREKAKPR